MAASKKIKFRGKSVALVFNFYALGKLEEAGIKMTDLKDVLGEENFSIVALGKLVWAGLITQFQDCTIDEVMQSLDISDTEAISDAVADAMNRGNLHS